MTHEELLAKIHEKDSSIALFVGARTSLADALRAIVELHKPINFFENDKRESVCGFEDSYDYPCPTINAIEKELK